METETIDYVEILSFCGRNGCFKQSGMEITNMDFEKLVMFQPITSKRQTGRAFLTIPKANLPELIKILQGFVNPR